MRIRLAAILGLVCLAGLRSAPAQQANVNLDYNPQKDTEKLIPFGAALNSPDVRDDRTVVFRVKAPEARQVTLSGPLLTALSSQGKPIPFQKGDDGVWSRRVTRRTCDTQRGSPSISRDSIFVSLPVIDAK